MLAQTDPEICCCFSIYNARLPQPPMQSSYILEIWDGLYCLTVIATVLEKGRSPFWKKVRSPLNTF
ncbi:hypothetical protein QT971_08650 [Microcoleus sp. herbarium19]